MKRFIVSLMVGVGALLSACTEEEETLQTVGLAGTYDVALVNYPQNEGPDLLFITSTDNNELRVLSLAPDEDERRFLRAPNPLEPLAIPVLPRPQALTRDVRYDGNGEEQTGRLVFARSNGTTAISVVSADRDVLREVRRLETTRMTRFQTPASVGPVTAFAARAPDQAGGPSTLYFATQETTGARLWQASLPARDVLVAEQGRAEGERTEVLAEPLGVALPPNVAVSSILVMPQSGVLAVATRGAAGTVGKTYRVDLGTKATLELNFGGAQVLQLATHGRVPGAEDQPPLLTEGQRIFGILDASSCGGQSQCTGVLAVEASTGEVARDATGHPMLPISAGAGLPSGLSLSTNTNLAVHGGEPTDEAGNRRGTSVPLLGTVPLSNGAILFFDALNLTPFNVNAVWSEGQRANTATASISLVNAQGASQDGAADITFEGTFGVTRDQTFQLTYQGVLPEMARVPLEGDVFKVPSEPRPGKGQVVQPGDRIVLLPGGTGGQPCTPELTVLAVQPPSAPDTRATLVPSGPIPEDCAGFGFFQVRAAGSQPLVLSSSSEDYIQRLGSGDTFSRQGSYFFHPPGYQGQSENLAVRIRVVRQNLDGPNQGLTRGDRYLVTTESHFFPYLISVDRGVPDLSFFRVPGSVVQTRVGTTDYAYIAYPSANGVLQVDLTNITAGVANSRGLFPFL